MVYETMIRTNTPMGLASKFGPSAWAFMLGGLVWRRLGGGQGTGEGLAPRPAVTKITINISLIQINCYIQFTLYIFYDILIITLLK